MSSQCGVVRFARAFVVTIAAQVVLLGAGWLNRGDIVQWWVGPVAAGNLDSELPWDVQFRCVLLATWVALVPFAASDVWRIGTRGVRRASQRRYHLAFAVASGVISVLVAVLVRALSGKALGKVLLFGS